MGPCVPGMMWSVHDSLSHSVSVSGNVCVCLCEYVAEVWYYELPTVVLFCCRCFFQRAHQWRLLRGGRLIIMAGTELMEWYKTCVWCIWYHSTNSAPAITTSQSSPTKVPPTSCVAHPHTMLFIGYWHTVRIPPKTYQSNKELVRTWFAVLFLFAYSISISFPEEYIDRNHIMVLSYDWCDQSLAQVPSH
jgi:hypothetical protein